MECFLNEGVALLYVLLLDSLFLIDVNPPFHSNLSAYIEFDMVIPKLLAALRTWAEKFFEHLNEPGISLIKMLLGSQFMIWACLRRSRVDIRAGPVSLSLFTKLEI